MSAQFEGAYLSTLGKLLGWLGLIPFMVGAVCSYEPIFGGFFPAKILIFYSAVVASFLGAVHWGTAIQGTQDTISNLQLIYSVMPSLLAWLITVFLGPVAALNALGVVFIGALIADRWFVKRGVLPVWYLSLRFKLTTVVCICLFSAAQSYRSFGV